MDFSVLERRLGVVFSAKELLGQALVHSSYAFENQHSAIKHNERLEFLGDAVLELITSEYLFAAYPKEPEGQLTNWRSLLVNTKQLSSVAIELGLNEFVKLSRGEAKSEGSLKESIMANVFEAVLGAMYLDRGFQVTQSFIQRVLFAKLPEILERASEYNPKGVFQEDTQRRVGITPTYEVLEESGPDHQKHFVVGVYLNKTLVAKGEGSSKHEARQDAAKHALESNWQDIHY